MRHAALGIILAGILCAAPASAEEVVRTFTFESSYGDTGDNGTRRSSVLSIDAPGVGAPAYALVGLVAYSGEGDAYLEMWSYFPDGTRYFSRTLVCREPFAVVGEARGWRRFVLPFSLSDPKLRPERVTLDVVIPSPGRLTLGTVELVQYREGEDPLETIGGAAGQWWGERTGGLFGGLVGGAFGVLGALIGILAGRGKARGFVIGALQMTAFCGLLLIVLAIVALAKQQPYAVWYPLALPGVLLAALGFGLAPVVRRRYAALERRRMQAQDAP